jgi:hypothetical protein
LIDKRRTRLRKTGSQRSLCLGALVLLITGLAFSVTSAGSSEEVQINDSATVLGDSIELWGGLYHGQSIEEVAAVLTKREDIKKVKVKKKRKVPVGLKISYREKKTVGVAGKRMTIGPVFDEGRLISVVLTPVPQGFFAVNCLPRAFLAFKELDSLLRRKYIANDESGMSSQLESELERRISERKIQVIGATRNNYHRLPENLKLIQVGYDDGEVQVTNKMGVFAQTYTGSSSTNQGMMNLGYNMCKNSAGFYGGNSITYMEKSYYDRKERQRFENLADLKDSEEETFLKDL